MNRSTVHPLTRACNQPAPAPHAPGPPALHRVTAPDAPRGALATCSTAAAGVPTLEPMPPQRSAVRPAPPPAVDLDEPLLTVAQVAEHLAVDPYTVRRYIGRGHLEAHRIGGAGAAGQLRVRRGDLEAFLANARVVRA